MKSIILFERSVIPTYHRIIQEAIESISDQSLIQLNTVLSWITTNGDQNRPQLDSKDEKRHTKLLWDSEMRNSWFGDDRGVDRDQVYLHNVMARSNRWMIGLWFAFQDREMLLMAEWGVKTDEMRKERPRLFIPQRSRKWIVTHDLVPQ
jgi:hypothetical protein